MVLLVGDIHNNFDVYYHLISSYGVDLGPSIQLGDFGLGMDSGFDRSYYKHERELHLLGHRFIRGNHDNPNLCRDAKCYLGDWGYIEEWDIFYLSGAWSIDWQRRVEDVDWWKDEELSDEELKKAIESYRDIKPGIVISHDAPISAYNKVMSYTNPRPTRTSSALETMFNSHSPKKWFFGHHHLDISDYYADCWFKCINAHETYDLEVD